MYARPGQIQERNILKKKNKLVFLDSKCESVWEKIIGEFWPLALQRYSS